MGSIQCAILILALQGGVCEPCPEMHREGTPPHIANGTMEYGTFHVAVSDLPSGWCPYDDLQPGTALYHVLEQARENTPEKLTKLPGLINWFSPQLPKFYAVGETCETLVVEALVDSTGTPRSARLLDHSDCMFVAPTLDAVLKFKFTAAEIDGRAVPCMVRLPFDFQICR